MRSGASRVRASVVGPAVVAVLVAASGLLAACTVPPPACPPEAQRTQPASQLFGVTGDAPPESLYAWLAAWWWANPANCPSTTDPEEPPAVVPEAPVTVLLPLAAVVTAGLGLVMVPPRRPTAAPA